MSNWQIEKTARNQRSFARLAKALPAVFPPGVLARALGRPFIPPTPRLAIESYWRAHPLRADRLSRALAARTGPPDGWSWRVSQNRKTGLPAIFRMPPAPYRECAHSLGPGFCCVCGQPVYRLGWHKDLWGAGPNKNTVWHCACVIAWQFWNAPNGEASLRRSTQLRSPLQYSPLSLMTSCLRRTAEPRQAPPPGSVGVVNAQVAGVKLGPLSSLERTQLLQTARCRAAFARFPRVT